MSGGELAFEMGPQPNKKWGTRGVDMPTSEIRETPVVPVPVINAEGKTFKGQMRISIETTGDPEKPLSLHYTTDGSKPTAKSARYMAPFVVERSSTIKAIAVSADGNSSLTASAHYHRIPHNWTISLKSNYSRQYSGGGDLALIDGIRGTTNWSGGAWQGYQGVDLVAVIDLGEVKSIRSLGAGFLQDVGSWIWMPRRIEFEVSVDGNTFNQVLTLQNDIPDGQAAGGGVIAKNFEGTISPQPVRYVRIRAVTFGKIPAWHPGQGGDAWIFADEIWVN
jgi:hypothetical protein